MATATRRRPVRLKLTEEFFAKPASPLKVDREQGIIYGVKVCGWQSKRGRRYTLEAAKKALPLYENAKVYTDHDEKNPLAVRKDEEAFGKLMKVRVERDGVYADLHYLKSHPLAEAVCEDVERGLGIYGLSHNADGRGERDKSGDLVIHDIDRVYSVDLVTRPATVENLWESESVKVTFKQMVKESKAPASLKKLILPLVEEYGDAEPGEDEADWKSHALNAIKSALDSEDPEKAREICKKIMALLMPDMPEEKEESESDSGPSDKGPTKEKPEEDGKEGKAMESLQLRLDKLEREKKYRSLCETAGVAPTEKFIDSLSNLQESDAKVLIEEFKTRGTPASKTAPVIRSQGPGAGKPSKNGAVALSESCDPKEFSRALRRIPRG